MNRPASWAVLSLAFRARRAERAAREEAFGAVIFPHVPIMVACAVRLAASVLALRASLCALSVVFAVERAVRS